MLLNSSPSSDQEKIKIKNQLTISVDKIVGNECEKLDYLAVSTSCVSRSYEYPPPYMLCEALPFLCCLGS